MGSTLINTLRLRGELSIRDGAMLAAQLLEAIGGDDPVLVDTTELVAADIAILQLLVSAHGTASAMSGKLLTVHAPEGGPLRLALQRSGIAAATNGLIWEGDLWTGRHDASREQAA